MKRVAAVVIAVLLIAAIPVMGQMTGARLSGTVKDTTGAVVTDAKVSVRNQATGIVQTTDTGTTGIYIFRGLNPGIYDITVEHSGFQTVEAKGLKLMVGQDLGYEIVLKVGAVSEKLDVTAETPLVESQKAQVDTVITSEQLMNTPVGGRFFFDLVFMTTPGVAGNNNGGLGEGLSVNGQRGYHNQFTIDGVTQTNSTLQSSRGRINIESIQEFQIVTHQYEPQYGNASGAVINVATKSGTNQVHGTAYTHIYESALNAYNAYQKQMDITYAQVNGTPVVHEKPDSYSRVFGATIGGPISRNKLFYFGSYEYSKEIDVHKITAPLEYNQTAPTGPTSGVWSGRLDYTPSAQDTFFFRYNGQRSNGIWGPGGANMKSTEFREIYQPMSFGATWMRTVSARTLSELRLQFAATLDSAESTQNLQYPYVEYRWHSVSGKLPGVPYDLPEYNGQAVYNLSMTRGRHDIKLGGSYMRVVSAGSNKNFGDGEYDFDTDEPFDPNNPWTYPYRYIQRFGADSWYIPENVYGVFAQDKWSITDKFVLTYGMRWDYENWFSAVDPVGTLKNKKVSNPKANFAPRISFAYSPLGPKTVIRGGFGRFYGRVPLNEAALIIQNTVNTRDQAFMEDWWWWRRNPDNSITWLHQVPYPVPPSIDSFRWNNGSVDVLDENLKYPYTDHWTLGIQQQLSSKLALNVDFVRILGKNQWTMVDRNAPDPASGPNYPRPNPDYFHIAAQSSVGHSWYTAMESTLKYRGSKADFTVTYTLAKSIDDVRGDPNSYGTTCSYLVNQDPDNIKCDRGLSANDLPHRLTFNGMYFLPLGFKISGVLDWRSGYPWSETSGGDLNGDGWWDRPVGVSRSTHRGEQYIWTQMRVAKEFRFGERYKWEPFVDTFNVTNTPTYVGYDGNVRHQGTGNPLIDTFGKPTGSSGPRIFQFGCRFTF